MKQTKMMKMVATGCAVVLSLFAFTGCGYNQMISDREAVDSQWANVESRYQERNDLVPNLVSTVKGIVGHEENCGDGHGGGLVAINFSNLSPASMISGICWKRLRVAFFD